MSASDHPDAAIPVAYQALIAAGKAAGPAARDAGLDPLVVELAAVRWLAIVIRAFNRIAILSQYDVAP